MTSLINFIFENGAYAHYIVFGALILAGFNLPISEDLLIIFSGILASTVVPENTYKLFIAIFLGCYLSDSISYWIGRILSHKLRKGKWFLSKKKLYKAKKYYKKHGFKTLLFGRFIPFGIRNCLFLIAGMGKMKYVKFLISDGIACLFSNIVLFSLTYHLGKNYNVVFVWLKRFNLIIFSVFLIILLLVIIIRKKRRQTNNGCENISIQ